MAKDGNNYPRHSLEKALRIPKGILEQNAGKPCKDEDAANYIGVKYNKGPFNVELVSSTKFGLLNRPEKGTVELTDIARQILKPQSSEDEREGKRAAALKAPVIADVYAHYRGENLPDDVFFDNSLTEKFGVPQDKLTEFKEIFMDSLRYAGLVEQVEDKWRVIDISDQPEAESATKQSTKKLSKGVQVNKAETVFVMMPFDDPLGTYYEKLYKPAIERAGLTPIRADSDIFGSGKIIEQIWTGINSARVLVAELTDRNPNVFYELGLAHALGKPVVLVSSNKNDVPFDLQHVRVIFYDHRDPFWGQKLIEKVKENILSAIKDPKEATLFSPND